MNDDFDHVPLETRIYDGDRAREVLENPAFERAFSDIEQELTDAWKSSPQRDVEGRERIHSALTMLCKLQACLKARLETGTLAKLELEHKNRAQKLMSQTREWLGV